MKKTVCFWLVLVTLLLSSTNSFSQKSFGPGYILTNNLDTIHGLINFKPNGSNSAKCEFKKDENSTIVTYSPFEINSYKVANNRFYVSKTVKLNGEEKNVFLEYLVNGIVDLYYYNEGLAEYFFLEKDGKLQQMDNNEIESTNNNGTLYVKRSNQYKGILMYLFHDVPEMGNKIVNAEFNIKSLTNLTKEYHYKVCTNETCIDYTKTKKTDIFCEAIAGIDFSFMGLTSSRDHANDIKPVFGLNLRIKDNRYNSKINIITGVNIATHSYCEDFDNSLFNQKSRHYWIDLSYKLLRVPITLEYAFLSGKFRPSLSATYSNCFILDPEYSLEIRNYYKDDAYVSTKTNSLLRKYEYGFMLGAGFTYYLNKNSYFTCVLNGEYRKPSTNMNLVLDFLNFKSMIFHVGYGYRIK